MYTKKNKTTESDEITPVMTNRMLTEEMTDRSKGILKTNVDIRVDEPPSEVQRRPSVTKTPQVTPEEKNIYIPDQKYQKYAISSGRRQKKNIYEKSFKNQDSLASTGFTNSRISKPKYRKQARRYKRDEPPLGFHPLMENCVGIDPRYPPHMFPYMYPHLFPHLFPQLFPIYCKNFKKLIKNKKSKNKEPPYHYQLPQSFDNSMVDSSAQNMTKKSKSISQTKDKVIQGKEPILNENRIDKMNPDNIARKASLKKFRIAAFAIWSYFVYMNIYKSRVKNRFDKYKKFFDQDQEAISQKLEYFTRDHLDDNFEELFELGTPINFSASYNLEEEEINNRIEKASNFAIKI